MTHQQATRTPPRLRPPQRIWTILKAVLLAAALFLAAASAGATMMDYPYVRLQSLDKATARTMTFEAEVGGTVKFGPLYIKVQSCRKTPPIETPESAAFLQIWEVKPGAAETKDPAEWVFSGWMYASSPSLSHMDHPIYDVWVLDCMQKKGEAAAPPPEASPSALPESPAPESAVDSDDVLLD